MTGLLGPGRFRSPPPRFPQDAALERRRADRRSQFVRKHWYGLSGPRPGCRSKRHWRRGVAAGPLVTARYGAALLWLATLSILAQGLYNIEVSRYPSTPASPSSPGSSGLCPDRSSAPGLPGPRFRDGLSYLAATAATPVMILLLGGEMPDPDSVPLHWWMHKFTATAYWLPASFR